MPKTIHEINAEFSNPRAKSQLLHCKICDTKTLHTTPFFAMPFRCIANHGGTTRCDGCDIYVDFVAKVVVTGQHAYKRYCSLCCEPDSEEKQRKIEERKQKAKIQSSKLESTDPQSIARFFGASSYTKKEE